MSKNHAARNQYQIVASELFEQQVIRSIDFKSSMIGDIAARDLITSMLEAVMEQLESNPMQFGLCTQLQQLGIVTHQALIGPNRGYRVIFDVNQNSNTVTLLLFLHTRQNLTTELFTESIRRLNR